MRWFRYVDNLIDACRSVEEAVRVPSIAASRLDAAGMPLKKGEGSGVFDLRAGAQAEILGFDLALESGNVVYRPAKIAIASLEKSLNEAHDQPHPPRSAVHVIAGWIESYGPAWADVPNAPSWKPLLKILSRAGFSGLLDDDDLTTWARQAWRSWEKLRQDYAAASKRP